MKGKDEAVAVWLDKASDFAEQLIRDEGRSAECRFRLSVHALAACVGLRGQLPPTPWTDKALESGKGLIAAAIDPSRKAHLQWDLGMALYDSMQVCQMRGEQDDGLKYAALAADYLEQASQQPLSVENAYFLGRFYVRLARCTPRPTRITKRPSAGSTRPCRYSINFPSHN